MKIAIGSDHGGFKLKTQLAEILREKGITVEDLGCDSADSVDYPDYAAAVADEVSNATVDQGIIVCTTGIGVSMTIANCFFTNNSSKSTPQASPSTRGLGPAGSSQAWSTSRAASPADRSSHSAAALRNFSGEVRHRSPQVLVLLL